MAICSGLLPVSWTGQDFISTREVVAYPFLFGSGQLNGAYAIPVRGKGGCEELHSAGPEIWSRTGLEQAPVACGVRLGHQRAGSGPGSAEFVYRNLPFRRSAAIGASEPKLSMASESDLANAAKGAASPSAHLYVPAAVRNREIGTTSEIAHMYPACLSARGPWPRWGYARTVVSLAARSMMT
ncbi:hypothetical protein PVT71_28930 (plasmid) [Salipiger sp. H15]|uniref:Uncharacterized protein n=1 Tax=Alloyangia sp. H15 TaxID=3029062 RepID=A0AAU8ASJ4_9RHOB